MKKSRILGVVFGISWLTLAYFLWPPNLLDRTLTVGEILMALGAGAAVVAGIQAPFVMWLE
jgi:hypothetical protein